GGWLESRPTRRATIRRAAGTIVKVIQLPVLYEPAALPIIGAFRIGEYELLPALAIRGWGHGRGLRPRTMAKLVGVELQREDICAACLPECARGAIEKSDRIGYRACHLRG